MSVITGRDKAEFDTYNSKSSTYRDSLWVTLFLVMPSTLPSPWSQMASGSTARANRGGDREQPCLVPQRRAKEGDHTLFVRIWAVGES